ncbi:MAG: hypothetical protein QM737_03925 [Ferruginibacter sp.]
MKKIFILIAFILASASLTFAQAPQGLNYQAVAYNGSGVPVPNQLLGVRLSILDGSATGTLVYQETQGPTTDNTGLFSIVIGNGTVVSGAFNTINWGNGSKWLKTEIDITGGTSYVVMGTTQFMSVPYALYANSAGFSGGSFNIPDGFDHITRVIIPDSTNYTVPPGKNLYIPTPMNGVKIDGAMLATQVSGGGGDSKTLIGASENSVVWFRFGAKVCFLVDKKVEWKTIDLSGPSFTVPANKQFVIVASSAFFDGSSSPNPMPQTCQTSLNGILYGFGFLLTNSILDEGDVLTSSGCSDPGFRLAVNGYLKDK